MPYGIKQRSQYGIKSRFHFVSHILSLDAAIQNHAERAGDHYLPGSVGRPGPHSMQAKTWKSSAVAERTNKNAHFSGHFSVRVSAIE